MRGRDFIIGIDEVGRGSLAGPVTVAAVALPKGIGLRVKGIGLRDSKRLTEKQRVKWFNYIRKHPRIFYAIAHVQPAVIDRINIREAANLAATRAATRLMRQVKRRTARIFLDGGLCLNQSMSRAACRVSTIIGGDEKYACIKLASIVAKVRRDRLMKKKHNEFPVYGFNAHVGYGTKAHLKALKRHGPSPLHRQSFITRFV